MSMNDKMNNGPKLGDSIKDYEVYEFLGKGGFAEVYRARSRSSGLLVAIKMVDKAQLRSCSGLSRRVQQEVAIHSRLKHPSILELYNYFEDRRYVYLVVEFCAGGALQGYLDARGTPLSESEARHLLRQVVDGLLYLHSHHILHRDLSPANLLLTKDLHVKIADFGLATRLSHPSERHTTLCGTPNFISPEVASRGPHGLEADVWGIGVLLYVVLTGRPPGASAYGLQCLPRKLSPDARSLLAGLLERDPRQRLPLHEVLQQPFFLRGSSRPLKAPSDTEGPQEPLSTHRLRPVRLRARHTMLSILPDGDTCAEFLRDGFVTEVCLVSADGRRLASFRPRGPGLPPGDAPPPLPADTPWLSWDTLPTRLRGRYACLARFVALVRQKTPKVVLYTREAACVLTEGGDFEASFYTGGKVVQTSQEVKVTDATGRTVTYGTSEEPPGELWHLFCQYRRCCSALEAAVASATTEGCDPFPAVFGRRPREAKGLQHESISPSSRLCGSGQEASSCPSCHRIALPSTQQSYGHSECKEAAVAHKLGHLPSVVQLLRTARSVQ